MSTFTFPKHARLAFGCLSLASLAAVPRYWLSAQARSRLWSETTLPGAGTRVKPRAPPSVHWNILFVPSHPCRLDNDNSCTRSHCWLCYLGIGEWSTRSFPSQFLRSSCRHSVVLACYTDALAHWCLSHTSWSRRSGKPSRPIPRPLKPIIIVQMRCQSMRWIFPCIYYWSEQSHANFNTSLSNITVYG